MTTIRLATMSAAWLLLLLLRAGAAVASPTPAPPEQSESTVDSTLASATPPPEPPQPVAQPPVVLSSRKAEVLVIDVTKNKSSVVSITIENEVVPPTNLTEAEKRYLKLAAKFRCIPEQKANIFILVHLNRNWRQKLSFVHQLLRYTYRQGSTNVAIVFFNAFTEILATFGTDPLTSEAELVLALAQVQAGMERDENAAVVEHWSQFQLDDALKACYRYAKLFLHQFSLDARPSLLFSYFDDNAVLTDATLAEAEKLVRESSSQFAERFSIMQWSSNLPVPPKWARVSQLLSSSPNYQVSGSSEDSLMGAVADLFDTVCNATAT